MASKYEEVARELAEAAMDRLHHDANEDTRFRHIESLTRDFIEILRRSGRRTGARNRRGH